MTFSLRTLLLLFPALTAAYALAYGCAVQAENARAPRVHLTHHAESLNLRTLKQISEYKFWGYEHAGLQKYFDAFLSGRKQATPPAVLQRLAEFAGLEKDSWGNPYRCVLVDSQLQFYSNGQDGISRNAGNDPDDLNSWNTASHKFYHDQYQAYEQRQRMLEALYYLPLTLGLVVAGWLLARKLVFKRFCKSEKAFVDD